MKLHLTNYAEHGNWALLLLYNLTGDGRYHGVASWKLRTGELLLNTCRMLLYPRAWEVSATKDCPQAKVRMRVSLLISTHASLPETVKGCTTSWLAWALHLYIPVSWEYVYHRQWRVKINACRPFRALWLQCICFHFILSHPIILV